MLEADQIVSRKFLHQGGKELCVESNLGDLHIQSNAEKKSLCVYMTRDRRRQATCFHTTLPRELFRWIVTDPVTGTVQSDREVSQRAIGDLKSIFNVSPSLLPDVLAELGIPQIGEPDEFEEEDEGTESEEVAPGAGETDVSALANGIASLSIAETPRTPRLRALSESSTDSDDSNPVFTPSAVATTASASRDSTPLTGFGTPTSDDAFASYSARRPLLYRQPAAAPLLSQAARREIDDVFRRMIDKVVRTARSSGALPLPRAGASAVFRDPEAGGGRISSMHVNNEWKARVGVAGELFVGYPSFS